MNKEMFNMAFIKFFRVDVRDETNQIRLKIMNEWLEKQTIVNWNNIFSKLCTSFVPTNMNPYPLVAHISELIGMPKETDKIAANATEAVSRIWGAIIKYGQYNSEEARTYIGELGWILVEREGGWMNLCLSANDTVEGTFKAQIREALKGIQYRYNSGETNAPSLPGSGNKGIKDVLKILPSLDKKLT